MPFAPTFSLGITTVGLVILPILASVPRLRCYARFVLPAASGLSLIAVFAALLEPVTPALLARWYPSAFFSASLAVQATPATWALAAAVTCSVFGAALVQVSRRAQPHFVTGLSALGLLTAALGSLYGANLLTTLLFWGAFDLAWALGMVAAGAPARRVASSSTIGLLATLALWAGALMVEAEGGSLFWHLFSSSGFARDLLMAAGVLRLGIYPLHVALPAELSKSVPGTAPLFLGPALGWGLLVRLAAAEGGALSSGIWLSGLGIATLVIGGVLAWTRSRETELLPWVALAGTGAILWGAASAGDSALLVLTSGGVAWTLSTALIYLGQGLEGDTLWWKAPSLLAGLTLLGAPPTPGLFVTSAVLGGPSSLPTEGRAVAFLVGEALLVAALARLVLRPVGPVERNKRLEPLETAARTAGVILPSLLLLAIGLHPPLFMPELKPPTLAGLLTGVGSYTWGVWGLAVIVGAALFWAEDRFRPQAEAVLSLAHDVLSLNWVLRAVLGGMGQAAGVLQEIAELIEGAGAVLWALSIFLLFLLALTGGQ